ncbi:unnamed protein product [Peniophora sp. CBMAI 1063]|nr:unnamed protein product [Peniophora sp. CBMAI 1063]
MVTTLNGANHNTTDVPVSRSIKDLAHRSLSLHYLNTNIRTPSHSYTMGSFVEAGWHVARELYFAGRECGILVNPSPEHEWQRYVRHVRCEICTDERAAAAWKLGFTSALEYLHTNNVQRNPPQPTLLSTPPRAQTLSTTSANGASEPQRVRTQDLSETAAVKVEDVEYDELVYEPIEDKLTDLVPDAATLAVLDCFLVRWDERSGAGLRHAIDQRGNPALTPAMLYTDVAAQPDGNKYKAVEKSGDAKILCPVCLKTFVNLRVTERHIDGFLFSKDAVSPEHIEYAKSSQYASIRKSAPLKDPGSCPFCAKQIQGGRGDSLKRHIGMCQAHNAV